MHDPRVGRFFAVDPLFKTYPYNSPYAFSENKVLQYIELEGLEIHRNLFNPLNLIGAKRALKETYKAVKQKVNKANKKGEGMSEFYEKHKDNLKGDEQITIGTAQIYFHAYFTEFGGFTDAEDVSVLVDGRTISGEEATVVDYSFASVGALIPFMSGGTVKQLFKRIGSDKLEFGVLDDALDLDVYGESILSNGRLEMNFQIPYEAQKQGLGSEMFNQSLRHFGDKVDEIQGLWTDGVNLKMFNEAVKDGMDPLEAAFETVTGKWAKKNGYDNVEVIQNLPMKRNAPDGDSGSVKVLFTKSK